METTLLPIQPTLLNALRAALPDLILIECKIRSDGNEAVFLKDGIPIQINPRGANPQGEGIYVVTLTSNVYLKEPQVGVSGSFDTAGPNGESEAEQLYAFLDGPALNARVILAAVKGTAAVTPDVLDRFAQRGSRLLGAVTPGDGWVFVGVGGHGEGVAVAEQHSPQGTAGADVYLGTVDRLVVPPENVRFIHALLDPLLGRLEVDDVLVAVTGVDGDARVEVFGMWPRTRYDAVPVRVTLRRAPGGRQGEDGALAGVLRAIVGPDDRKGLLGSLGVPACFDLRPLLVYASNTDRTNDPYEDPGADRYLNDLTGGITGRNRKPTGGRYGRGIALVEGLTLIAPLPETFDITGAPEVVTTPLQQSLELLDVDGGDVEVTLGETQATVLLRLDGTQSLVDTEPLKVTLARRQAGYLYARKGAPGAGNRPLRETGRRPAEDEAPPTETVTVEADADVAVAFDAVGGLGFPKDDTARMTLGLTMTSAGAGSAATGWMRVREDAVPWQKPFGLPGVTVEAFYAAVDLTRRKLQALFGDVTVTGVRAQLALRIAAKRAQNLAAFRLQDDVPVFGWLARMVAGVSVPQALDGIVLAGMGRADGLDAKEIAPADYNVYVVPKEQTVDGKTFPAGVRFHGTLRLWTVGLSADLALAREPDGRVHFEGAAGKVTLGDLDAVRLDLGGDAFPFDVGVDPQGRPYGSLPYDLDFLGLPLSGRLTLDENGPAFGRPGERRLGRARFRVTRLEAGKDLGALRVGAEVTYEWRVSVDDLHLPDAVAALSPVEEVEAQATLAFTVEDRTLTAELNGRVSGLGDLPSKQVAVSRDDMQDVAGFIEETYEDAVADLLKQLADPFGNLPVLGDAIRFLYGLADESLGRLLGVADALGVKLPGADRALQDAGLVAGQVDHVLGKALDWARKAGIPLGGGVGRWAVDAVGRGLGLAQAGAWVKALPDLDGAIDDLGDFAGDVEDGIEDGLDGIGGWFGNALAAGDEEIDGVVPAYIDKGHHYLEEAGIVLFTSGDRAPQAYPLGSYPDIANPWLEGFRTTLIPRGWKVLVYDAVNFGGRSIEIVKDLDLRVTLSRDFEVSADISVDSAFNPEAARMSMKVLPLDRVVFFEDSHYRGDRHPVAGGSLDTNEALHEASSMLVPPGWMVRLRNDEGRVLDFAGSVDSFEDATDAFYEATHQDYDHWNDDIVAARVTVPAPTPIDWQTPRVAWGRTAPGDWKDSRSGTEIRVEVTFGRPFVQAPVVVAALAGNQSHYFANGVNTFSSIRNDGFTVAVDIGQGDWLTAANAAAWGWRLQWIAFVPTPEAPLRDADPFAAGFVGGAGWKPYREGAITMRLASGDRWRPGENPPMLTALVGGSASDALGVAAPYGVRPDGADVYVLSSRAGETLTVGRAMNSGWTPLWVRPRFGERGTLVQAPQGRARFAGGRTAPGEGWAQYVDENDVTHPDTITLRIDTSRAGFTGMPLYVSQITGDSSHWTTVGASAIYEPSAAGFRVYVRFWDGRALTPDDARTWNWHLQWIGVEG